MLNSGFKLIAVLMAAITLLSVPWPFWSSTRRLMMLACGAMPSNVREYFEPFELDRCPRSDRQCVFRGHIDRWRWSCPNETLIPDHAGQSQQTTVQVGMAAHSAIHQRDANPGARIAGLPGGERVYGRRGVAEVGSHGAIQADVNDIRLVRRLRMPFPFRSADTPLTNGKFARTVPPSLVMSFTRQSTRPSKPEQLTWVPGAYCTMTCVCWLAGRARRSGDIFVLSACARSVNVAINSRSMNFFIFPHSMRPNRRVTRSQVTLDVQVRFQSGTIFPLSINDLGAGRSDLNGHFVPLPREWDSLSRADRQPTVSD